MVDELEKILNRRADVPEASSNLAERIIEASKQTRPQRGFDWTGWLQVLIDDFVLPQPAFAMGLVLMFGLMVGVSVETSQQDDREILYMEEILEAEEWL